MVRRVTPSQYRNIVRQAEQRRRQAVDKLNRDIRSYNQKAQDHNRKLKQSVDKYNREVRSYNARVRSNRQRLKSELARLSNKTNSTHYVTFRASVGSVQRAYEVLERAADAGRFGDQYNEVLDLSEREAANNAGLMNALLGETVEVLDAEPDEPDSPLIEFLSSIDTDLADRWGGALYALSPRNPDAARHFCTSAREIVARILEVKAPDAAVIQAMPECERTPERGTPTRRAKIQYFLRLRGIADEDLGTFIDTDVDNIVQLFGLFNKGTHGAAGTFNPTQLKALRRRVEDGLQFLSRIAI